MSSLSLPIYIQDNEAQKTKLANLKRKPRAATDSGQIPLSVAILGPNVSEVGPHKAPLCFAF